jgi:PAS domain S-box-containing protein
VTKDGREREIEWYGKALKDHDGNVTGVLVTGQDITERRSAETALREGEEMLRLLFEHANDGINVAEYDPETAKRRLMSCNDRYVELSGRSREELFAAENLNALVEYPHSREQQLEWHRSTLRGVPYRGTGSWHRPDGKENTYEWTAAPIRRGGKILIVGVDRDITERLRAERALREHEEMLRLLFDHANDGINIVEYDMSAHERRLITCNERYVEMSGRTREELMAAADLNLFVTSPNWREKIDEWDRKLLEGKPYQGIGSWVRPDGKENTYEWTAVPVKRGDRILVFGIDRDITERIRSEKERARLEHQLMQAQKLEAIGTLAGGVAHDFNNLLTGIIGYANLLKMDADPGAELHQTAAAIEGAARRGGQLTAQLLTFARKSRRENVSVDVHEIVAETAELLRRTLGENIAVELDLKAPASTVRGDPAGLQRVLLNLAVNARDAMPDGGRLGIGSAAADLREGDARLETGLKPGRYFVLSVTDTGRGIPDEIRDRIFEPFFTTKPPGQGTGMGLAIAYGTVRDHGGAVQVAGQVARGATFHVYLPLAGSEVSVTDEASPGEPVRGSGRILVVDDEEVVRDSVARMLRGLGYHVAAAEDGPRAVEYFRARHAEIDAVIIDMVMPGMSGIDCFLALKEIDPGVKAVLTTGYGLSAEAGRIVEEGLLGFVEKPYGLFRLSQAVARAVLH